MHLPGGSAAPRRPRAIPRLVARALLAGAVASLLAGCAGSLGTAWGGSIGAVLARDNRTGKVTVYQAPEGRAAARAGLLPGDELVTIEGRDVRHLTADQVHAALEGSVGTKVKVTVLSESDPTGRPHDLQIERGPLDKP